VNVAGLILTAALGAGGLGGLAVLYRARADRGNVVVETVSKGVLVLERINDRIEAELENEHAARVTAERELAEHMRACHPPIERNER
jgi:hypothetical protein